MLNKKDKDLRKNASGCNDPTAYEVLKNLEDEEERFHKLLHTIFYICKLADFKEVTNNGRRKRIWLG